MKMKRHRLVAFIACLLLALCVSPAAYAHEVPDMDRLCSLTLTMRDGDAAVPGGSLALYRVGEVVEDDGNYGFQPAGEFTACGESFRDLSASADMAERLQAYAQQHSLAAAVKKTVDDQGRVSFTDLPLGLYLVVQPEAAPGYEKISPFLVSLPYREADAYCYDLVAGPKTELEKAPVDPPDDPPNLPQTGQLWWPVPILACAGLLLFLAGVLLDRRRSPDGK